MSSSYSTLGAHIPRLRKAYPDESADLSALARRSKAHWGYDRFFLEQVHSELEVGLRSIAAGQVFVIELADELIGFCALDLEDDTAELTHCFVDPAHLRQNYGRLLWNYAVRELRRSHPETRRLRIISDPHAAGFYRRCGARTDGFEPAAHDPKRLLPRLIYSIPVD